jgi:predicted adenylyl cyclase CyaB
MVLHNFEFKVRVSNLSGIESKILELNPVFKGEDNQVDTYFNVQKGRLKLREGKIENALIYYERPDTAGVKQASIILYRHKPEKSLKDILSKVNGVKVVVEKTRRIYFIENVKFHFDTISELGTFVEVEAIDETGQTGIDELREQCNFYFKFFGFGKADYINRSYSDMILEKIKE